MRSDQESPNYDVGERCNRDGCKGIIEFSFVDNCSCHIVAPCSAHENVRPWCPVCGWELNDGIVVCDDNRGMESQFDIGIQYVSEHPTSGETIVYDKCGKRQVVPPRKFIRIE